MLAFPAAALGAAWVAPQNVNIINARTGATPLPQVGVDAQGDAALAMLVDKGPPRYVQVTSRGPGSSWAAVSEIGQVPANLTTSGPSLAVDPAGNAVVAWADTSAAPDCPSAVAPDCLQIWKKPAGSSTWSFEHRVTASFPFTQPVVALDPRSNGNAVVAWQTSPSAMNTIQAVAGTLGGAWSGLQTVEPGTSSNTQTQLHTAIDDAGHAVVMWHEAPVAGGCPCTVSYAVGAGTWSAPANLDSTAVAPFASLFLHENRQGNIDAAWAAPDSGNTHKVLKTAKRDSLLGTFGSTATIATLPSSPTNIVGLGVMTASDGEQVASWTADSSGITVVRTLDAASRAPAAPWSAVAVLDPSTGSATGPALAMDGAGNTTAVWYNAASGTIRFNVHPHGGSFDGTFDAQAGRNPPVAAADDAGHVTAGWAASTSAIQTLVYDPVPPTLGAFAAPAATAGVPVGFSESASDIWSNPVAIHWDFGDGTSADGASVSHTYSGPGSVQAKVTATDAAGNATSQTQTVNVAPAPPPPPPPKLARPVASKTVNLELVSGTVLVKVPGSAKFVPLTSPTQVQVGSIIDARHGRVRITIDNGRGGFDTADFYGGIFRFTQPKVKPGKTAFADLFLVSGSFKSCPAAPKHPRLASLAKGKSPHRSVRHLWGSGNGAFRTVGRFSSATVRGTTWLTDDHCDGTLTKVTAGKVGVRDFVKRKTIVVKKGKSYFAKPKGH